MSSWKPGQSGNPKGRAVGSGEIGKLRASISVHIPSIIDALVTQALGGDSGAARLLLERVLPTLKSQELPIAIDLPEAEGLTSMGAAVMRGVSAGDLLPGQGAALLAGLGALARIKETDELTARIERLEAINHDNS